VEGLRGRVGERLIKVFRALCFGGALGSTGLANQRGGRGAFVVGRARPPRRGPAQVFRSFSGRDPTLKRGISVILSSESQIREFTEKGYWGTETLSDLFLRNVRSSPSALALVDPPNRADARGQPAQAPHVGRARAPRR
jgi:hypothetical protein